MQDNKQLKIFNKKKRADKISKTLSLTLSWLFSLTFFCLIVFIIYASIPGFKAYGFKNIIFTNIFDLTHNQASIWLPFAITIIVSVLAILFAAPIGVKTAFFINFRLHKKLRKPTRLIVELLADIPSVIFGLFAAQSLGSFIKGVFNIDTAYSLLTASSMLIFMILPTIISLTLSSLANVNMDLISSSMVLGNSKTKTIYKIIKKEIKSSIIVAIIIAFSRAIGETMAISMILQSQGYNTTFDTGLLGILCSNLRTLGALISANMFAEGGGPALQGLLFAFGVCLFIFVMILNVIANWLSKPKQRKKIKWVNSFEKKVFNVIYFIPLQLKILWEKLTYKDSSKSNYDLSSYIKKRVKNNKFINVYSYWKIFWEYVCTAITLIFIFWILINILGLGAVAIGNSAYSTIFSFSKDTTGQAFINTLLVIVIAIGIGLPMSLLIALYLNEFARSKKVKRTILFFIDSLGATPSILFGMFGLIFFIQTLGWSSQGVAGKSLIAGAITILIVILPTFIRTIQQALQSVPYEMRTNSLALGAGKWETIRKIILPCAMQGIITSVVLSIGRILAETAPLYLTSGLGSSSSISLSSAGQTLTTRIYNQIYTSDITKASSIMYECAFVTMILVFIIILFANIIIPWYFKFKYQKQNQRFKQFKLRNKKK